MDDQWQELRGKAERALDAEKWWFPASPKTVLALLDERERLALANSGMAVEYDALLDEMRRLREQNGAVITPGLYVKII